MCTDKIGQLETEINQVTELVIGCAYRVQNVLGCGFLEKVYENALAHDVQKTGLAVNQQQAIHEWYDGLIVGEYVADLVVDGRVLVELKAVKALDEVHAARSLNYLQGNPPARVSALELRQTQLGDQEVPLMTRPLPPVLIRVHLCASVVPNSCPER